MCKLQILRASVSIMRDIMAGMWRDVIGAVVCCIARDGEREVRGHDGEHAAVLLTGDLVQMHPVHLKRLVRSVSLMEGHARVQNV